MDHAGIPSTAIRPRSQRLEAITKLGQDLPAPDQAKAWTASEWQVWLAQLSGKLSSDRCTEIDRRFKLTQSGNYEILVGWLEDAVPAGYPPAIERAEQVVGEAGRMKYLKPLYRALAKRDLAKTQKLFERNRAGYHPIAAQVVEGLLAREKKS